MLAGADPAGTDAATILGREQALGHVRKLLAAAPRVFGDLAATAFPLAPVGARPGSLRPSPPGVAGMGEGRLRILPPVSPVVDYSHRM